MHWSLKYVGMKWIPYATGPDAYDCWGLVFHCLKTHYNIDVDRFKNVLTDDHHGIHKTAIEEAEKPEWIEVAAPQEGAVVLMSTRKVWHHVGIYTNSRILHSRDGSNVAIESIDRVTQTGVKKMKFYLHDSLRNDT